MVRYLHPQRCDAMRPMHKAKLAPGRILHCDTSLTSASLLFACHVGSSSDVNVTVALYCVAGDNSTLHDRLLHTLNNRLPVAVLRSTDQCASYARSCTRLAFTACCTLSGTSRPPPSAAFCCSVKLYSAAVATSLSPASVTSAGTKLSYR